MPNEKLGRVSSIDLLGSYCLLPMGYALAGVLTDRIGPAWIFIAGGAIKVLLDGVALCIRDIRRL